MFALLILAGCGEIKESEKQAKKVEHKIEKIQKSEQAFQLTDEEMEYMKTLDKSMQLFTEKTGSIKSLMQEATDDHNITRTEEWSNQFRGEFMTIKLLGQVLVEMSDNGDVPERFESIHQNAKESFVLLGQSGDKIMEAIDSNDNPALYEEGFALMQESNDKMNVLVKQLKDVNK